MTSDAQFLDAVRVAACAHQDQKYGDLPYLVHVLDVADKLRNSNFPVHYMIIGILHDVVEDSGVSVEDIRERFGSDVADPIATLTKEPGCDQGDYIRGLHRDAVSVKFFDSMNNFLGITPTLKTMEWRERKVAEYLKNISHLAQRLTDLQQTVVLTDEEQRTVDFAKDIYPRGWGE